MTTIPNQVLTMPLAELRERTELAERLALAARLTPEQAPYAGRAPVVQPAATETAAEAAASTRKRRTKAEIAADEAAAAAAAAKTETPATVETVEEDDGFSMDGDTASDGGDMLGAGDDDDFVGGEVEADVDYKAEVIKMAQAIKASADSVKLGKVRAILAGHNVQKITDLPDSAMKGLYTQMKAI